MCKIESELYPNCRLTGEVVWDECRGTEHQRHWEGHCSVMEVKSPSPELDQSNVQETPPCCATGSASADSYQTQALMTCTSDGGSTSASKRQGGKQKSASNGSASSHGSSGGGRHGGERLPSSSSSGGNSGDDDDDDRDDRRRRRPNDVYCKPQSRPLLPCDEDDDEITDSADEGGEESELQPPPQKQLAAELFAPSDSFQSVSTVYESSSSGHPILKPLSPTSLSVGYGAELAASRIPDGGEHRDRTPTLDSPHPSEGQVSSGGLLSPEITILQQATSVSSGEVESALGSVARLVSTASSTAQAAVTPLVRSGMIPVAGESSGSVLPSPSLTPASTALPFAASWGWQSIYSPFCGTSGSVATTPAAMTNAEGPSYLHHGQMILLQATVCHESEGMLIVSVRWRNRTFSGSLIDVGCHEWAPPRLTDVSEAVELKDLGVKLDAEKEPVTVDIIEDDQQQMNEENMMDKEEEENNTKPIVLEATESVASSGPVSSTGELSLLSKPLPTDNHFSDISDVSDSETVDKSVMVSQPAITISKSSPLVPSAFQSSLVGQGRPPNGIQVPPVRTILTSVCEESSKSRISSQPKLPSFDAVKSPQPQIGREEATNSATTQQPPSGKGVGQVSNEEGPSDPRATPPQQQLHKEVGQVTSTLNIRLPPSTSPATTGASSVSTTASSQEYRHSVASSLLSKPVSVLADSSRHTDHQNLDTLVNVAATMKPVKKPHLHYAPSSEHIPSAHLKLSPQEEQLHESREHHHRGEHTSFESSQHKQRLYQPLSSEDKSRLIDKEDTGKVSSSHKAEVAVPGYGMEMMVVQGPPPASGTGVDSDSSGSGSISPIRTKKMHGAANQQGLAALPESTHSTEASGRPEVMGKQPETPALRPVQFQWPQGLQPISPGESKMAGDSMASAAPLEITRKRESSRTTGESHQYSDQSVWIPFTAHPPVVVPTHSASQREDTKGSAPSLHSTVIGFTASMNPGEDGSFPVSRVQPTSSAASVIQTNMGGVDPVLGASSASGNGDRKRKKTYHSTGEHRTTPGQGEQHSKPLRPLPPSLAPHNKLSAQEPSGVLPPQELRPDILPGFEFDPSLPMNLHYQLIAYHNQQQQHQQQQYHQQSWIQQQKISAGESGSQKTPPISAPKVIPAPKRQKSNEGLSVEPHHHPHTLTCPSPPHPHPSAFKPGFGIPVVTSLASSHEQPHPLASVTMSMVHSRPELLQASAVPRIQKRSSTPSKSSSSSSSSAPSSKPPHHHTVPKKLSKRTDFAGARIKPDPDMQLNSNQLFIPLQTPGTSFFSSQPSTTSPTCSVATILPQVPTIPIMPPHSWQISTAPASQGKPVKSEPLTATPQSVINRPSEHHLGQQVGRGGTTSTSVRSPSPAKRAVQDWHSYVQQVITPTPSKPDVKISRHTDERKAHSQTSGSYSQASSSHAQALGSHTQVSGSHSQASISHLQGSGSYSQASGSHSQVSGSHAHSASSRSHHSKVDTSSHHHHPHHHQISQQHPSHQPLSQPLPSPAAIRNGLGGGAVVPNTEEWIKLMQMEALKMQSTIPFSAPLGFINPQDLANWQAQLAAMNMSGIPLQETALQMQQLAALQQMQQMQQQAVAAAVQQQQQQQQQQQHTEAAVMAAAPQFQIMPFVHPMNLAPISAHTTAIHDPSALAMVPFAAPFAHPSNKRDS